MDDEYWEDIVLIIIVANALTLAFRLWRMLNRFLLMGSRLLKLMDYACCRSILIIGAFDAIE
jgi:hypothetical protein